MSSEHMSVLGRPPFSARFLGHLNSHLCVCRFRPAFSLESQSCLLDGCWAPVHPTASQSPCLPGSPWPSPSVGYKGTFPRLRLGVSADPSLSPNCAAGETRHRVFRPLPSPRPPSVCLAELLSGSHESSLQISSSLTGTALSGFLLPPPPTPGPM